jgi:hypothetical protein
MRRKADGAVLVKYDNAHAAQRVGRRYRALPETHDHRHIGERAGGRPYPYASPSQLLEDFFADVEEIIGAEERKR